MNIAKQYGSIGIIWLFHLSAIIGITLGYSEWFLSKTPLNLILSFIILLLLTPLTSRNRILAVLFFFVAGMFVEWVGVTFGIPFGTYSYGNNLGLKLDGVPYLIGINWTMLILITGSISSHIFTNFQARILFGAFLMVFLDLFIEPSASAFDFWHWENEAIPLQNYVAWFAISLVLHWVYQRAFSKGNFLFSINLYLAELLFFFFFYAHQKI